MTGGQKPLVNIQRAELVSFKRAPTPDVDIDLYTAIQTQLEIPIEPEIEV